MTATIGVPQKAQDMKQIRVFVDNALFNRYGQCSRKALQNAIKHDGRVRVTFTRWQPGTKGKDDSIAGTFDELVSARHIRYKQEAV